MDKPAARGSYPETAVPIPEQMTGRHAPLRVGQRIRRMCFPIDQAVDSAVHRYQETRIAILGQTADAIQLLQRIEFGRTGSPSPQPACASHPETAIAIFIKIDHAMTEAAVGA